MIRINMQYIGIIWLLIIITGFYSDTSKAESASTILRNAVLLEKLTSPKENERFKVLEAAIDQNDKIEIQYLESALKALRPKVVSTLIYVYIKTNNSTLYNLSIPSKKVLEGSESSFPNIALYYARVNSNKGQKELRRLYQQYPNKRMAICKAIGEIPGEKTYGFLLSEAKTKKNSGETILNHLAGLKISSNQTSIEDIKWFLDQELNREELIALSKLNFHISKDQLCSFWTVGGRKKTFAIEIILGDPIKYFAQLQWIIDQLLNYGQADNIRQILLSDSMRNVKDTQVAEYRDITLKKLQ